MVGGSLAILRGSSKPWLRVSSGRVYSIAGVTVSPAERSHGVGGGYGGFSQTVDVLFICKVLEEKWFCCFFSTESDKEMIRTSALLVMG